MEANATQAIPKKVWICWMQGLDEAPSLVKLCYQSWKDLNPNWEIIFLDKSNVADYVDIAHIQARQPLMEFPAISDILRLKLLSKYGGVWVDATCLCRKPLDSWLPSVSKSGFFVYYRPVTAALVSMWFVAASSGNPIVIEWARQAEAYLLESSKLARRPKIARWFKWVSSSVHTTRFYFTPICTRLLKFYPYYWCMYLFTEVIRKDLLSRRIWEKTPKFNKPNPDSIHPTTMLAPLTDESKREIDTSDAPMFKLSRRYDENKYYKGCVLDYVLTSSIVS